MEPWKPAQRKPGQLGEHTDEYKASSSLYTQKIEQNIKPMSSVHLALWISNHILLDTCSHCGKLPLSRQNARPAGESYAWVGARWLPNDLQTFFPQMPGPNLFLGPLDGSGRFLFSGAWSAWWFAPLSGLVHLVSRCFKWASRLAQL